MFLSAHGTHSSKRHIRLPQLQPDFLMRGPLKPLLPIHRQASSVILSPSGFLLSCTDDESLYLYNNTCTHEFTNTTLNSTLFNLSPDNQNLSLFYECTSVQAYTPENVFWCVVDGTSRSAAYCVVDLLPNVPLFQIIHRQWKLKVKLIIGLAVAVATLMAIGFIVLFFRLKTKSLSSLKSLYFHLTGKNDERVEAFILQFGSLAPKRFSYLNIKKITNSFKDKLGQGGYGSVYKGELLDGRIVAVKVLRKSIGDGQDFINEVASISRTSHVNIVSLLGFCYERSKRALIYEFMPNGSLDKFICNQGSRENHQLAIKTLYEIALGIARGLEYLHRGCTTRILHFDIKPQNILLDANFCPKISDFGLAKLCETRDTIVSMTGARGTCGYIAPEVFCRNFGGVSYKSDVYSYGMMVLEMIGGRGKNINVEVSHSSEMYFPTSLYKQLEKSEKLNLDRFIADEEEEMTRKMIVVSLWCIQTIPSNRPSMSKVLEWLQGSQEALPLPPEPLLSSPAAISLQNSNTTSSVIMQGVPSTFETTSLRHGDDEISSNT
ncbi:hypothetical protein SLEP1_g37775 [Rubroshorea leprosula]|uniref:Protein kinase domain-containing protein n=1 Tax=Rubroshorea leprosula TaxID=152421 RepID=A0AAV5KW98_9ROSI|nr:hypothetical protein SLEP1_g37775 [Rubroshorea leprosula]